MSLVKKFIIPITLLIAVLFVFLVQANKTESNEKEATAINENVVSTHNFNVSAASTSLKSSASGTVYVKGDRSIQIVASIEIDANDWGGIAFYIPKGWHIRNIFTSYPEQEEKTVPVALWDSTNEAWNTMIEVGRNRNYKATKGGSGTVVIDLTPEDDTTAIKHPSFTIEIGSSDVAGVKTMGTDFIEIPISLK